jgi:hypothetical protein
VTFSLTRRLAAECLGTGLLVATVVGSGIMGERLAGGNVALALLGNTLPTGAILVVLILALGSISGAHFNPAVSLVMGLRKEHPWREFIPYAIGHADRAIAQNIAEDVAGLDARRRQEILVERGDAEASRADGAEHAVDFRAADQAIRLEIIAEMRAPHRPRRIGAARRTQCDAGVGAKADAGKIRAVGPGIGAVGGVGGERRRREAENSKGEQRQGRVTQEQDTHEQDSEGGQPRSSLMAQIPNQVLAARPGRRDLRDLNESKGGKEAFALLSCRRQPTAGGLGRPLCGAKTRLAPAFKLNQYRLRPVSRGEADGLRPAFIGLK